MPPFCYHWSILKDYKLWKNMILPLARLRSWAASNKYATRAKYSKVFSIPTIFLKKNPTRCMVMMPIKPSTKIGKFIISGSGFQALGCRQIRLYRRNLLFLQQEQINWIYCYDVLEALYQIFENIDQGQGPGPWVEPILPQWNYLK